MRQTQWLGDFGNRRIASEDTLRLTELLDASRRRAAELEQRRRIGDDAVDIADESLDELWCALDLLHDAVTSLRSMV